nr:hypothetical protein [uncultured Paludibaculum sp.]
MVEFGLAAEVLRLAHDHQHSAAAARTRFQDLHRLHDGVQLVPLSAVHPDAAQGRIKGRGVALQRRQKTDLIVVGQQSDLAIVAGK